MDLECLELELGDTTYGLSVSPDGARVAVTCVGGVITFDAGSLEPVDRWPSPEPVEAGVLLPDGELAVVVKARRDGRSTGRLQRVRGGEIVYEVPARMARDAVSLDDARLFVSDGFLWRIHDAGSGEVLAEHMSPDGFGVGVQSNGQRVVRADRKSGTFRVNRVHGATVKPGRRRVGPPMDAPRGSAHQECVAVHPAGAMAAIGGHGGLWIWSLRRKNTADNLLPGHTVQRVGYSPDGRWLAALSSTRGHGWLTAWGPDGRWQVEARHGGLWCPRLAFAPDNQRLYTSGWGRVYGWRLADGHRFAAHQMRYSGDARRSARPEAPSLPEGFSFVAQRSPWVLAASHTGEVWSWMGEEEALDTLLHIFHESDLSAPRATGPDHLEGVGTTRFSPDGRCVATRAAAGGWHLTRLVDGQPVGALRRVHDVVFLPDDGVVLGCHDGPDVWIERRTLPDLELRWRGPGFSADRRLVCSPAGRFVALAGDGGRLRVWQATDGALRADFAAFPIAIGFIEFDDAAGTVAVGDRRAGRRVYRL